MGRASSPEVDVRVPCLGICGEQDGRSIVHTSLLVDTNYPENDSSNAVYDQKQHTTLRVRKQLTKESGFTIHRAYLKQ